MADIRFKTLKVLPTTFLDLKSIGIQWELEATLQPPNQFEFFVERSGSPQGPFKEIAGPLNATFFIDTRVNRFSKHREVFYRVRARNKVTSDERRTTDPDAAPYFSNWDRDRPRGAVEGFEEFVSGAISIRNERPDLLRMEIIRRNNLLLKRFVGVPTAILKARTFGQICPDCFSEIEGRVTKSFCPSCFGTTFLGGYFDQINLQVNFDLEPKVTRIEVRGEIEDVDDTAWMSNFPILSPRDVLVRRDGVRWLVMAVQPTELKRVLVKQALMLRRVNPNEKNIFTIPVDQPELPTERDFIGFAPKTGSGLL